MALEQTLNKDCGKFMHLCTKENALLKYYLTAHQKAAVAANARQMSRMTVNSTDMHKGASDSQREKDEKAIQAIVKIFKDRMVSPFIVEEGASPENKQPLVNIATATVAPADVTNDLESTRS